MFFRRRYHVEALKPAKVLTPHEIREAAKAHSKAIKGKAKSGGKAAKVAEAKLKVGKSEKPEKLPDDTEVKQAGDKKNEQALDETSGAKKVIGKATNLKAYRVYQYYGSKHSPLLASGLAYQGVFALFAALWFTFSVLGFVISGNQALQDSLVKALNSFVPGLIGGKGSVVAVDTLLSTGALGWSSVISLATILFTALGFLATLRAAMRQIFELEDVKENFALRKLKDLGLGIGFGILLILGTGVSVLTLAASGYLFNLLGISTDSPFPTVLATIIGMIITAVLDTLILMFGIRVLSGIDVPWMQLLKTALIGGIVLAFLQTLGSGLLGAPKNNPLFASFAIIFGLLVYFNFVCQVILFCVAWLEVSRRDMGLTLEEESAPAKSADRMQ